MTHGGGASKIYKKCDILFEWPLKGFELALNLPMASQNCLGSFSHFSIERLRLTSEA
jgi:hypothetical protein